MASLVDSDVRTGTQLEIDMHPTSEILEEDPGDDNDDSVNDPDDLPKITEDDTEEVTPHDDPDDDE